MLMTLDRAAETLATCKRTVIRAIERGQLRIIKIGASVRIHPDDLEQFINHNRRYTSQPCLSENVVNIGISTSRSQDSALEQRLEKGRAKPKRKS